MKNFSPKKFYSEIREELSKVTWPTKEATMGTSLIVVIVVAIITAYLGAVDVVVSRLMQIIIGS